MSVDLFEQKARARRDAAAAIRKLSGAERGIADGRICSLVAGLDAFRASRQVLAYWALPDEVCVRALLETAASAGKAVYLPAIRSGSLEFRRWAPGEPLRPGALGVLEPASGEGPRAVESVTVVPGRAFDLAGHRLGRGKGYYDRAWSRLKSYAPRVGVGYACQILPQLPHDAKDGVVDLLVCDTGLVARASR